MTERTLSIIKPDATKRNLIGKIISRFEELEKLGLSVEDIMNKLSNEFPTKSQNDIKQILLNIS